MPPDALLEHVEEVPLVRRPIVEVVTRFARSLRAGSRVLDAGAGDAPYRALFGHCDYVTADWPASVHDGARGSDIIASLDDLPVDGESFDAVLCTEVLEHVAEPDTVLSELARVLVRGGQLCVTVPFVWPLHEEPFDFYRYTPFSLSRMLERAGFTDVTIEARGGYFTTLAQIADMSRWLSPSPRVRIIRRLARVIARLARGEHDDDQAVSLPLGYCATARLS